MCAWTFDRDTTLRTEGQGAGRRGPFMGHSVSGPARGRPAAYLRWPADLVTPAERQELPAGRPVIIPGLRRRSLRFPTPKQPQSPIIRSFMLRASSIRRKEVIERTLRRDP